MSDSNANGGANGQGANNGGQGNDPSKNGQPPANTSFDLSKVSDEDFPKLLEDKRLWDHPRIKDLREKAAKAKEYEANKSKEEEARLLEQKKFEELAGKTAKERDEWKNKHSQAVIDGKLIAEASKRGIVDPDAVTKLLDRSKVKINDDGSVEGLTEALDALVKDRPYLVGKNQPIKPTGGGSNPPTDERVPGTFKMSEISNTEFYQKHEKEIKEAMRSGKIIDDR